MRLKKCINCGELVFTQKRDDRVLCAECYYRLHPPRYGAYYMGDQSPDVDVDMQEWLADRYMTTPKANVHKMDWND